MKLLNHKIVGSGSPLYILHGLFGSLDNWQSVAKELGKQYQVILVDVRNHGRSFHDDSMNFDVLNDDILHLMQHLNHTEAYFMGHSMGGKILMFFAGKNPEKVIKLIVVDVAPYAYPKYHQSVFHALFAVPINQIQSRQEAEQILRSNIEEESEVQFLMKGLSRKESGGFEWKFNLEVLHKNYVELIQHIPETPYLGPTLFIKGEKSNYISIDKMEHVPDLFPNYEIEIIKDAGHWVHADNGADLIQALITFLEK